MNFLSDFNALSSLLTTEDEETISRDKISKPGTTPAAIGPKDLLDVKVPAPKARKDPKEIWDEDELVDVVEDDVEDGREVPNYEFMYKQSVETTDTFLGMSGKDPSSTQCDELVVKIELPGVSGAADVDLDVKPTYLKLSSPQYKLSIYLPHKVDHEKGRAKFDKDNKTLSVTLRIIREDPF